MCVRILRHMSGRKRPRGGRDEKIRLALDMCNHAHRRGDVETKKRAFETLCTIYDVNPTELTEQGIREVTSLGPAKRSVSEVPPASPSVYTENSQLRVGFERPALEHAVLKTTATPPPTPTPTDLPLSLPLDTETSITDPETVDRILDDIEKFLTGNVQ